MVEAATQRLRDLLQGAGIAFEEIGPDDQADFDRNTRLQGGDPAVNIMRGLLIRVDAWQNDPHRFESVRATVEQLGRKAQGDIPLLGHTTCVHSPTPAEIAGSLLSGGAGTLAFINQHQYDVIVAVYWQKSPPS